MTLGTKSYQSNYTALVKTRAELPETVQALIGKAWDAFVAKGFPTAGRGSELWKYTNVNPIADGSFQIAENTTVEREQLRNNVPWNDEWTTVVLVDGHYSSDLSNLPKQSGLQVLSLSEACVEMPQVVETHLGRYATDLGNAFIALNTAFIDAGVIVKVDAKASVTSPIQVVYIGSQGDSQYVSYPRVLFVAGAGSNSTLLETFVNQNSVSRLMVGVGEIVLEDGATVQHYRAQLDGASSYHISHTRVWQGADTQFNSVSLARGSKIGRYDIKVNLSGTQSQCKMYGLYMTAGDQHQSNEISTTHTKPHCTSRQFFKGILSGKSRAVFSGKVTVEKGAMKTDAQQKDLNLLLSRGAEIDTKPSLEIYADDVKCGHGATAGHLDEMTLFYLQSRGLSFEEAMAMQAYGFASEIVDMVSDKTVARFFEQSINNELPKLLSDSDYTN